MNCLEIVLETIANSPEQHTVLSIQKGIFKALSVPD